MWNCDCGCIIDSVTSIVSDHAGLLHQIHQAIRSSGVSNLFGRRVTCNLRMIARATGATKTLILKMCIFTIIRTINIPTVNSTKFSLRVDISMSSLSLFFFNKLGKIRQDRTIFFSTKAVCDQKIRDFHVSDRGAPRIRQGRWAQPRVWGRSRQRGQFSHKKILILAHFFNEKGHAVSAVTRDHTKIFSQLMVPVCLKAEA